MYDKEKLEDSIEFCNNIKRYYSDMDENMEDQSSYPLQYNQYTKLIQSRMKNPPDKKQGTSYQEEMKNYQPEPYYSPYKEETKDKSAFGTVRIVLREIFNLAGYLILAFLIANFITNYIGHHTVVEGISMEDTLSDNDILIIDKLTYQFKEPERYDIVIFPYSKNDYYIKRVIGLPGETVQITGNTIYIDGVPIEEEFGKEEIENPGIARVPISLGEEEYFVLGDNRNHSQDSRSYDVGLIKRRDIIAKAWLRIYPFNHFGILKHQ